MKINFKSHNMILFKGYSKGIVYLKNIYLDDIRAVFFPRNFYEKYRYLGSVPYMEGSELFDALYPLIMYLDRKAKPSWCPRWVLRFLHLFGSDNSLVRVRNHRLHSLKQKLTKGFLVFDYKTKWSNYDLRISVHADKVGQNIARQIEKGYFVRGKTCELLEEILSLDPGFVYDEKIHTLESLSQILNELEQ